MQSNVSLSLFTVKVPFSPLSITCTGSSSPGPPVNRPFVGASQHSKGILAGEDTQTSLCSDDCCSLPCTAVENAKCFQGQLGASSAELALY